MRLFGVLTASLLAADALVPSLLFVRNQQRVINTPLHVSDWDNDDFLNSLKPPNDDDELPSEGIEGAVLSDEMKEKMKADDETPGGGTRLQRLMDEAKNRAPQQSRPAPPLKNPFADNPFAGIEGMDSQQSAPPASQMPANPDELSVEEQARLFRQMMQGQQQQQPQAPAAEPPVVIPPPPRPPRPDAKVGRNRDADSIQNTADVYFAQLKRDSTVRAVARIRGDNEKANAVFEDPGIKELDEMLTLNPHLQYVTKKNV